MSITVPLECSQRVWKIMEASELATLEVPDEPGVWFCARHKKVKTRLRCGRCETPICPKCTRMGPTGARCPACASNRTSHIYQVTPPQYALAVATAVILGSLAGWVVRWPILGLLTLFYAPAAGTLIGKAVSWVTKGKRGTPLAFIAAAGVVLGALIPIDGFLQFMALLAARNAAPNFGLDVFAPLAKAVFNPFVWLYLFLALPSVWWWLKE
jgi:hypothetical protein